MRNIEKEILSILPKEESGHGLDHAKRVRDLALKFADEEKNVDKEIIELACLLHDVDDYKIFGVENEKELPNATKILKKMNISPNTSKEVLSIISRMGYSKFLDGIRPETIEGKIVSDADMCDAIGAQGILRSYAYNLRNGTPFFDKNIEPDPTTKATKDEYRSEKNVHAVQHFFDKLLKINQLLMTKAGKEEGAKRQAIMVEFLHELFRENSASRWIKYLNNFLEKKT